MSEHLCELCSRPCVDGYHKKLQDAALCGERWSDAKLPEDDAIKAAHPLRTGRHDLYAEAMRLVGARHSKSGLVELVNWLLAECATARELIGIKASESEFAALAQAEAMAAERDEARADHQRTINEREAEMYECWSDLSHARRAARAWEAA